MQHGACGGVDRTLTRLAKSLAVSVPIITGFAELACQLCALLCLNGHLRATFAKLACHLGNLHCFSRTQRQFFPSWQANLVLGIVSWEPVVVRVWLYEFLLQCTWHMSLLYLSECSDLM